MDRVVLGVVLGVSCLIYFYKLGEGDGIKLGFGALIVAILIALIGFFLNDFETSRFLKAPYFPGMVTGSAVFGFGALILGILNRAEQRR